MASDDYYTHLARTRLQQIDAAQARARADLEEAKVIDPYGETATEAVQQLADLNTQRQSVLDMHKQYVRSQRPPEQPEPTREERHARDWTRMDAVDVLNLARTSKYASNLDFDDPHFVAGAREAAARRARGE